MDLRQDSGDRSKLYTKGILAILRPSLDLDISHGFK